MINLNFTEKELETLKEYFQSELYKAEQQIDNIRGILSKISKKHGKPEKSEKKSERKLEKKLAKLSRKKEDIPAKVKSVTVKEKKRPGRKPKVVNELEVDLATKILKKRGRPPKVKIENATTPAISEIKIKTEKLKAAKKAEPKSKPVKEKAVKTPKVKGTEKETPGIDLVKKKRGRPSKQLVVAEKKTPVVKTDKKTVEKKAATPVKVLKVDKKNPKKKEPKAVKIPWGDWILTVLRESEINLNATQIFDAVSKKVQLTAEEFASAESKLKDQINNLLKSKKILSDSESENPVYSLKITGKGL